MNVKSIRTYMLLLLFLAGLSGVSCEKHGSTGADDDDDPEIVNKPVTVWLTTRDESNLLKKYCTLDFTSGSGKYVIQLDTTSILQGIDGFGAALTGSSAYLIQKMTTAARTDLLYKLFDPDSGIGISYLRIPIGSSDFSLGNYTYCDEPDLEKFAIPALDKRDLIPVLKSILEISPDMKIMATPWSAPAWMKNNQNLYGGSLAGENFYADFADYFVKYIQTLNEEGISIHTLSIQNEPAYESSGYPSMLMDWSEQNSIIKDYLGPAFAVNNIHTGILIWDHNFDGYQYPLNILNDPDTYPFVAGTAFHGYGGTASQISQVQQVFPDKDIYFTEISGGGWNTDDAIGNMLYYMKDFLMPSINLGSKNFLMWNLALDQNSGPVTSTTGGCQDCRGVVTISSTTSYAPNEEYYLLGHFAKFVRSGAHRVVYSVSDNLPDQVAVNAFMNADGSKVVVILNQSGSSQSFTIGCGNRKFTFNLTDDAVATFVF